jgi:membrane protein implicated in regulation of membrane protease activity
MAELSVATMNVTIQADGSAAIAEMERVGQAAEGVADAVEGAAGAAQEAGDTLEGAFEGAEDAAEGAGEAGREAGEKIDQGAQKAGKSLKEVGETLSKVGEKATKLVTLPIMAALTASVKGASDLTETVGKTEVVFDRLSDKVMAWSENSVQAMGLAQGSALEYASTFGDMGKGMGLALDTATEMSMKLTQLAADLASFKNIRTDVAAQKLNAVYTGETEGLKSLGIVMTQTNLEAFALSQGITKQVSAMSQAELVSLRYQYVLNATKDAQGDFARTGDSLANQTRKLTETIKQAGESFGSQLIPMVTPVVEKIQQWAQGIAELDSRTKNLIIAVAATAAAVGPLLLVGGKLLTFLATLKASLAALSINPVFLAIGAVAAAGVAIAGISRALNRANGDIDDTSEAFKRLKAVVEKGAEGEVKVDDSALEKLPDEKQIDITADANAVLDEAARIVMELRGEQYKGQITIDGDPEKAEAALAAVEEDIRAAKESVTIDGNGDAVIGDAGLIKKIKDDLATLDKMVVITDDPVARAALEEKIEALKTQLNGLVGSVKFSVPDGDLSKIKTFREELEKLPKDPNYKAVGSFEIEGQALTDLEGYTSAMMEAASATGNFKSAVEQMQDAIDKQLQEQIAAVRAQAYEQIKLIASLNGLNEEEQLAQAQAVIDAMDAKIAELEAAADASKKAAEVLDNGTRGDDTAFVLEQARSEVEREGSALTSETGHSMLQAVADAEGADLAAMRVEGEGAKQTLIADAVAQYEGLTAAVEAYNRAQADAAAQDQTVETLNGQAEAYARAQDGIEMYMAGIDAGMDSQAAFALALESMGENADPTALEALNAALVDGNGSLISYSDALDALNEAQAAQADAAAQAADAQAEADRIRGEAAQTLQDSLGELKETALSSEAVEGAVLTIGETGVDISGAEQALLSGVPAAVEAAYTAAEAAAQGGEDPAKAIAAAVEASAGLVEAATTGAVENAAGKAEGMAEGEGKPIGSNLIEGARSGIRSKAAQLAEEARRTVRDAINAAKAEAQIRSPSRVMRNEVGAMMMRGAAEGIEQETPKTVQVMRRSAMQLISGAAAVTNRTKYAAPAYAGAGAAGMDYEAMGAAMQTAMSRVRFGFSVGARELAVATREDNAQQLAVQSRRVSGRYGG